MNLYFLENYNNYFNRVIKPTFEYRTIDEFEMSGVFNGNAKYITGVNFNFQDGVNTNQVINWNESWSPDYMLLVHEGGSIHSTWFVIDSTYTRNGQFNVSLRRDVVNDYYEKIIESPMYVEKATINDRLNPLLYNSEGMVFNQIKQEEKQLFDSTGCGWIVGYVAKPQEKEEDVSLNASANLSFDYIANDLPFTGGSVVKSKPNTYELEIAWGLSRFYATGLKNISFNKDLTEYIDNGDVSSGENNPYLQVLNQDFVAQLIEGLAAWKAEVQKGFISNVLSYNGKVVCDTEANKYYRIKLTNKGEKRSIVRYTTASTDAAAIALKYALDNTSVAQWGGTNRLMGFLTTESEEYEVEFIEMPNANMTSKISKSRLGLVDAPYDMFAIPYGRIMITEKATSQIPLGITNAEAALNIALRIPAQTATELYDIQLLPYCPCPEYMVYDNVLVLDGLQENIHYNLVSTEQSIQSIILWCSISSRTFTIKHDYFVKEPKVENECDMWRIVSPNYQGMFEFSAAKNGGINGFTVDYTYKPYNPYIHVAPVWGNLYGSNFGDSRGLICGGDFSLPQTSDAFRQYEVNNKNYQNIFDRGIQNLDINRKHQRINEIASSITGSVASSVVGAKMGGVAGGVIGGVLGAAAGMADFALAEAQYKENKDYQTDLYNFNLGNVKAMPDSLTKTSALTNNHKIVPVLEYYSCTDKEKEALRNKLKYNGMTVMAIGQLKDYLLPNETFVKGQLIRIDAAEDNHMATTIFNELQKGVFVAPIISEE